MNKKYMYMKSFALLCFILLPFLNIAFSKITVDLRGDGKCRLSEQDVVVLKLSNTVDLLDVSVKVYDKNGKYVRSLFEACMREGAKRRVVWNLKDWSGKFVKAGEYVIKVRGGMYLEKDEAFGEGGMVGGSKEALVHFNIPSIVKIDDSGSMYVLDLKDMIIYKLSKDGENESTIEIDKKFDIDGSLGLGKDGKLWLGTRSKGLVVYDSGTKTFSTNFLVLNKEKSNRAICLGVDSVNKRVFYSDGGNIGYYIEGKTPVLLSPPINMGDGSMDEKRLRVYFNRGSAISKCDIGETNIMNVVSFPGYFVERENPLKKPSREVVVTNDFAQIVGIVSDGENGVFLAKKFPPLILKFFDGGKIVHFVKILKGPRDVKIKEADNFYSPKSIAVDPQQNMLYVLEDGVLAQNKSDGGSKSDEAKLRRYKILYEYEKSFKIEVRE